MIDIKTCLQRAQALQTVSDSARLDTEILLAQVLQKDRSYLFTWPEKHLSSEQLAHFEKLFVRREKGEPIAHILGQREFWSLPLQVNASTLIPRPDTELLIEIALDLLPQGAAEIADLGTGTGAIALALASENKRWNIRALDFSGEACDLAESNRQALGFNNVSVQQSNWFSAFTENDVERFNLIVSNPPYIDKNDHHLGEGDVRFEPLSALVAEDNGLADFIAISNAAGQFLKSGGYLLFEHGYQQAQQVQDILTAAGFVDVRSEQDLNGNDRATLGCFKS